MERQSRLSRKAWLLHIVIKWYDEPVDSCYAHRYVQRRILYWRESIILCTSTVVRKSPYHVRRSWFRLVNDTSLLYTVVLIKPKAIVERSF